MALDYIPSPGWAVIYGETPSATRWSELGDNDDALATGAGLDDNSIIARHVASNAIAAKNLATNAIKLGYAQITANFTTTTNALVTGLSVAVTNPTGGRSLKISAFTLALSNSASPTNSDLSIEENGVEIARVRVTSGGANYCAPATLLAIRTPAAGASLTYNARLYNIGGATAQIQASANSPAFVLVEVI